jgi:hypothetical protein
MDKAVTKTKVDERFKDMFDAKRFGSGSTKVDKYGRKNQEVKMDEETTEHFFKEGESEEETKVTKKSKKDKQEDKSKDTKAKKFNKKKQELEDFHWSAESSSEDEEIIDEDLHELLGEKVVEYDFLTDEEEAEVREISSKRLALMNYDWAKIKVGDIFITLSSFLPAGGNICSVKLYQSEFGKNMMDREQAEGPIAIWDNDDKIEKYQETSTN